MRYGPRFQGWSRDSPGARAEYGESDSPAHHKRLSRELLEVERWVESRGPLGAEPPIPFRDQLRGRIRPCERLHRGMTLEAQRIYTERFARLNALIDPPSQAPPAKPDPVKFAMLTPAIAKIVDQRGLVAACDECCPATPAARIVAHAIRVGADGSRHMVAPVRLRRVEQLLGEHGCTPRGQLVSHLQRHADKQIGQLSRRDAESLVVVLAQEGTGNAAC